MQPSVCDCSLASFIVSAQHSAPENVYALLSCIGQVTVVHSETTTGLMNDVIAIGRLVKEVLPNAEVIVVRA